MIMPNTFNLDTQCTKDEAVGMLLGWLDGPVRLVPPENQLTPEEQEDFDSFSYDLQDDITERLDSLNNDYAEAKFHNSPANVITDKLSALNACKSQALQAKAFMSDLVDELNKGELSALRLLKNPAYDSRDHITLASLDEWARSKYGINILADRIAATDAAKLQDSSSNPVPPEEDKPAKGGLARTRAENLYTTFAFLVEEFANAKGGKYKPNGKVNVSAVASHLDEVARAAIGDDEFPGQGIEAIKKRIEEAMRVRRTKLPKA